MATSWLHGSLATKFPVYHGYLDGARDEQFGILNLKVLTVALPIYHLFYNLDQIRVLLVFKLSLP